LDCLAEASQTIFHNRQSANRRHGDSRAIRNSLILLESRTRVRISSKTVTIALAVWVQYAILSGYEIWLEKRKFQLESVSCR